MALLRGTLDAASIAALEGIEPPPGSPPLVRAPEMPADANAVLGGSCSMQNGPIVSVSQPGAVHCVTIGTSC